MVVLYPLKLLSQLISVVNIINIILIILIIVIIIVTIIIVITIIIITRFVPAAIIPRLLLLQRLGGNLRTTLGQSLHKVPQQVDAWLDLLESNRNIFIFSQVPQPSNLPQILHSGVMAGVFSFDQKCSHPLFLWMTQGTHACDDQASKPSQSDRTSLASKSHRQMAPTGWYWVLSLSSTLSLVDDTFLEYYICFCWNFCVGNLRINANVNTSAYESNLHDNWGAKRYYECSAGFSC